MFHLEDRSGKSLALRPEGTAGVCRFLLSAKNGALIHSLPHRFSYHGPMFRYERPQKGRHRQFTQFGVESFGESSPFVDAEIITLGARIIQDLGLSTSVKLQVNSLGDRQDRERYRTLLTKELESKKSKLSEDSRRRLERVMVSRKTIRNS
mmetsp:Transcript_13615/g.27885  ORF Transcript_13615/g.27885 Transcript_13615/m.27885 type:complete len:151 (-) Transcript_13615:577-1029(-)